MFGITES